VLLDDGIDLEPVIVDPAHNLLGIGPARRSLRLRRRTPRLLLEHLADRHLPHISDVQHVERSLAGFAAGAHYSFTRPR
jgi:hypothetical protein